MEISVVGLMDEEQALTKRRSGRLHTEVLKESCEHRAV
jgi:hypothetical protein